MRIENASARLYNVAEYIFGDKATERLDEVADAVDQLYCDQEDADMREAFHRYLACNEALYFSSGICESLTSGFGKCSELGYFEFPLPAKFIDQFYGLKKYYTNTNS